MTSASGQSHTHAALAKTPRDVPALLGVLDGLTGGDLAADLPLSILSQVTEHVAALSKRKAPKLLQQKRAFVRGWHTDTRQLLGGNGGIGDGLETPGWVKPGHPNPPSAHPFDTTK